jgi:hypothetical protein
VKSSNEPKNERIDEERRAANDDSLLITIRCDRRRARMSIIAALLVAARQRSLVLYIRVMPRESNIVKRSTCSDFSVSGEWAENERRSSRFSDVSLLGSDPQVGRRARCTSGTLHHSGAIFSARCPSDTSLRPVSPRFALPCATCPMPRALPGPSPPGDRSDATTTDRSILPSEPFFRLSEASER